MPPRSALNTMPGQFQHQPGKPMNPNDPMAYAGGNPNFDERTGRFINPPQQMPSMGQQIAQGLRPQQPLQRLSPGVYRGPDGSLVNSRGGNLPNQPQRQPQATIQPMQPMQPNPYARDQFPGRNFPQNMMPQPMQQNPWVQNFQPYQNPFGWPGGMAQGIAQGFNPGVNMGVQTQFGQPQDAAANAMQGAMQGLQYQQRR